MGAIHDAGLPLKRVEGAYRYRYIGIHEHRFRGAIPGLWSRNWPLFSAATGSVGRGGGGIRTHGTLRPSKTWGPPECKSGALSLSATPPIPLRSGPLQRAFSSASVLMLATFLCPNNHKMLPATKMCSNGRVPLL
jgi:hypothetical protein